MPKSRKPAPVAAPNTLRESAPATVVGHAPLTERAPTDKETAASAPRVIPATPDAEQASRSAQGDTQISTFHPDELRPRGSLPSRTGADELLSSRTMLGERLRNLEHRLDQLDARLRLVEKGIERGNADKRVSLLWWGALLLIVFLWAAYHRLR